MPSDKFDFDKFKRGMEERPESVEVAKVESEALEKEKETSNEIKKTVELHNKTIRQNIKLRKKYAFRIFFLICCWIASILIILIMNGFNWNNFHLSDAVLMTLITTTTATVFGLFVLVTRYLFNTKDITKSVPLEK